MGYTVSYSRRARSYAAAVKRAKKVSYSLRQSDLPNTLKGFRKFLKNSILGGQPYAYIDKTAELWAHGYVTASRRTEFMWSSTTEDVVVKFFSDRENFSESESYRDFISQGWELSRPPEPWSL